MTPLKSRIAENHRRVLRRVESACRRSGRDPAEVRLVAVTKYAEVDWILCLVELGVHDLGENRPQQLLQRAAALPETIRWHLVGHLQRNKVRPILPVTAWIHSVDSVRLLDRIERLAGELNRRPRVLLEVNVSGEESKYGFSPSELQAEWPRIVKYQNMEIAGLMTMAPYVADPEQTRPVFRELRELRDRLRTSVEGAPPLPELSMGMSNDFEVAVEEGATMVRIGSLLFEGLST
ncbi:MAG: YggS family pyridoxal phosphate-dependent enzyme, partial [Planctomycetes bacterium]|nr:YggS family pyridoxal phosphate-dependent enzyme [Planctomycetota bacterium]